MKAGPDDQQNMTEMEFDFQFQAMKSILVSALAS